ncbi:hypothetical protein MMC15_001644 [Xylographa vitiligo]|nr:hypothetical protein [Xylographa vitiligo]
MSKGACAIGIYVQNPSGSTFIAHERWEKILWTTVVAIDLYVGTVRAGWSLDFPSGVQICFFFNIHQTGRFDLSKNLEWNLNQSPFFQGRGAAGGLFPELIPMTETQQWFLDLQDRLIQEGRPPWLAATVQRFTAMSAGSWGTRPIVADCEAAISHLGIESWFISRTGVTPTFPMLETDGHCTLGIYLTYPIDPATGTVRNYGHAQGLGIDIVQEATKLVRKLESQHAGGAYIDLENGLELCLDSDNGCANGSGDDSDNDNDSENESGSSTNRTGSLEDA